MTKTPVFIQYRDSSGIANHLIVEDFDYESNIIINTVYDLMDEGRTFYQSCLAVFDRITSQYEIPSKLGKMTYVKNIFVDDSSSINIDSSAKKLMSYRNYNGDLITIYADEVINEGEGAATEYEINNAFPMGKYGGYSFDFHSDRIHCATATGIGKSRIIFPLFDIKENDIHTYLN